MTERRGRYPPPPRSGANPYPNARLSHNGRTQTSGVPARLDIPQEARNENTQGAGRGNQATTAGAQVTSTTGQGTYPAVQGASGRGPGAYDSRPGTHSVGQSGYGTRSETHDVGQGSAAYLNPQLTAFGSQFGTSDTSTPLDEDLDTTGAPTSSYPTGSYHGRIVQGVGINAYDQPRGSSQHPWAPPQQNPSVAYSLPPGTNARPYSIPQQSPFYNDDNGYGSNNQQPRNFVLQDPSTVHYDPNRGFNRNVDSLPRQPRRHLSPPSADYDPHQLSPYLQSPSNDSNQYGRQPRPLQRKSSTTTTLTQTTINSHGSRDSAPRFQNVPDPLVCEDCLKAMTGHDRITNMKRHKREQHEDHVGVRCPSCGREFTRPSNLKRHRDGKKKIQEGKK